MAKKTGIADSVSHQQKSQSSLHYSGAPVHQHKRPLYSFHHNQERNMSAKSNYSEDEDIWGEA